MRFRTYSTGTGRVFLIGPVELYIRDGYVSFAWNYA